MSVNEVLDWTEWSLKEQIGQMVVVRASGYLFDHQIRYPAWEAPAAKLQRWLQLNLGGVILLGGSAGELYLRIEQLQNWSKTPLLVAADIEEGVGQWFAGATQFPPPMALGAIAAQNPQMARQYAAQIGAVTAQEAVAVGLNWVLAPVVDVNNNPDNPVINVRSFADNPALVGELATAYIEGAKPYPVLTTAKHFPGHGDTATDSHLDLPVLPHSASRLEAVELGPFRQAIAAGVDSVMSAHLRIPAWDAERPATLSPSILTAQLRQRLGFEGLIVTDALIMGGVAKYAPPEETAVMAVEAGADILLMPADPEGAIAAVEEAVHSGRLSRQRIEESVARIWRAKSKVVRGKSRKGTEFLGQLATPEAMNLSEAVLRQSLKRGGSLPAKLSGGGRNLMVVDDLFSGVLGRHTPAVVYPSRFGYQPQLVDSHSLPPLDDSMTLLQVFSRGNPFRGSAGLTPQTQDWLKQLLKTDRVLGLLVYGSPYVLEWLQAQINDTLPWVYSFGQMPMAQAIAHQTLLGLSRNIDISLDAFL